MAIDDSDPDQPQEDFDLVPARFPIVVRIAGALWIILGALAMIGNFVSLAQGQANQGPGAAPTTCCSGLIGLAFVVVGHQTITGQARDTRGNGIGSIALGCLQWVGAAFIALGGFLGGQQAGRAGAQGQAGAQGINEEMAIVIAVVVALSGSTLILAGVLALAGRTAYLDWREENALQSRRRRRRPRDEEEENDRPRRGE